MYCLQDCGQQQKESKDENGVECNLAILFISILAAEETTSGGCGIDGITGVRIYGDNECKKQ